MICRQRSLWRPVLLTAVLSSALVSCASSFSPTSTARSEASAPNASMANKAIADVAGAPISQSVAQESQEVDSVPRSQPQLAKSAELVLTVGSVSVSLDQVKQIAQQQQGDLLDLQDNTPTGDRTHHTASLQIRVPQTRLDAALQALKGLGTVQRQSLTAEDVSDQLVDYQARLRNLRKTEATLLDIMDRSGSVADVLKVAQELSNVRNSIEQLAAQLTTLQNRVAYSTIHLNLEEAIAALPPQRSATLQLQETWSTATRSLGKSTVDLMQLGIWLLVYSPYWVVLAAIGWFMHSRLKTRQTPSTPNQD